MPTPTEIASRMMAALRLTEPELDTSIGTPLRKIFDAVAEQISEGYVDQHLLTYQYDIDSKVEGDLDDFVALFGFTRIPAQRARGVVTFSRPQNDASDQTATVIPIGMQVLAQTNPLVYAQTEVSAVMNPAQTTVDVPVQALVAGPQGNVAAGLLTTVVQAGGTVTGAINTAPLANGSAQESDEELRTRFKATVFRSLAGTQAMYEGIAREVPQDPDLPDTRAISQVNVLGSSKRYREQIQVVAGVATSTIPNAAYIFADNVFCGPDLDGGSFLTPGVHFTFTPSNPTNRTNASVVLASLSTAAMPDGLYDLDFEYVPQASRNDPGNTRFGFGGVNNRIDIWANGIVVQPVTQTVVFSDAKKFTSTAGQYQNTRFIQNSDAAPNPLVNNIFIPMAWGPLLTLPDTISYGGVTYIEGTDYWIVHQDDCFGYGPNSLFGIAWSASKRPVNGAAFSVAYTHNKVPQLLQDAISQWRLVGTDARAHAGKRMLLRFNLAVMYDRRYDAVTVNTLIDSALSTFLAGLGFEAAVQASDILQVVHNVPGVDNVRFLNSTDNATNYAIQRISPFSLTVLQTYGTGGRAIDIQFADDQYPAFHSTVITIKAANTFGVS